MANQYDAPGVYIEYLPTAGRPIQGVGTSTALFVGPCPGAKIGFDTPKAVTNFTQFLHHFGSEDAGAEHFIHAVGGFFANGGTRCYCIATKDAKGVIGDAAKRTGLWAAAGIDEPALLAIPGVTDLAVQKAAIAFCEQRRDIFAILDAPSAVPDLDALTKAGRVSASRSNDDDAPAAGGDAKGLNPGPSEQGFASFNFPWITITHHRTQEPVLAPASGHLAGLYARTDAQRGVHKAPANEIVVGALDVAYNVAKGELGMLNRAGVNVIRAFPRRGIRMFGARTVADQNSEWRYVNVKRFLIFVEETLKQALMDAVFDSNDQFLQASMRMRISSWLEQQRRAGALTGSSAEEAFFVKCDAENNPPEAVAAGEIRVDVGLAIVRPAEFVIVRLSQSTDAAAASA